jgi:hypothetical protein
MDIIRAAIDGLLHHRLRAALSMLGISWGIVSVVILLAYGNGFHQALVSGFEGALAPASSSPRRARRACRLAASAPAAS